MPLQMHLQLRPIVGATALEAQTQNLIKRIRRLSSFSVPNFKTFYHMVLGAAIDSNGRRTKKKSIRKSRKQRQAAKQGIVFTMSRALL